MLASLNIKGAQPRKRATPSYEAVGFTNPHETAGTDMRDEELRRLRADTDPAYDSYIQEELSRQSRLPVARSPTPSEEFPDADRGYPDDFAPSYAGTNAPSYPEPAPPQMTRAPQTYPYTPTRRPTDPAAQRQAEAAAAAAAAARRSSNRAAGTPKTPANGKRHNSFQNKTTMTWISTNTTTTVALPSAVVRALPAGPAASNGYPQLQGVPASQPPLLLGNGTPNRGDSVVNAEPRATAAAAAARAMPPPLPPHPQQQQQQQPPQQQRPPQSSPPPSSGMAYQPSPLRNGAGNPSGNYGLVLPPMNPTLYGNLNRGDSVGLSLPSSQRQAAVATADVWNEL